MNHRIGRMIFALAVGLAVAVFSYRWITDPAPRAERAVQEQVVENSRTLLRSIVASDALEIVDPLSPNRKVGKVYVYPEGSGWAVSGYYRRTARTARTAPTGLDAEDSWHPYLLTLTGDFQLVRLKAKDGKLADRGTTDPRLEILP